MAKLCRFAVLSAFAFAACSGPSVTKTTTNPPDPRTPEYNRFVAQRTKELLSSGVCKNEKDAAVQAGVEADRRFGPLTPEYSTTTTWGPEAKRQKQQADIESGLEKMKREQAAPNTDK